jgi:hypothetical protein
VLLLGLIYLDNKDPNLFHQDTLKYQFAPGLGYQPQVRDAGGSIIVKDLKTAVDAIDVIVIQGEGSPGPFDDLDKLEKDHYDVFLDLKEGDTTWETYRVVENPVTSDYWKVDERIYHVSFASNIIIYPIFYLTKNCVRFHSHLMRLIASSYGRLRLCGMLTRRTADTSSYSETCSAS